jgi:large repetitive protein
MRSCPTRTSAPRGATQSNVSLGTGAGNAATHEATFSTSSLSVGTHVIKAQYLGDSSYYESGVSFGTGLRVQSLTTITLTITPSGTQLVHTPLTFTAAVKANGGVPNPTTGQGTVKFLDTLNGTLATGVSLNASGVATFSTSTLFTGVHTITAIYSGATDYRTSHQAVTKTIVLKFHTLTTIASSINPAVAHHVITFTATVHPSDGSTANSTGAVLFKDTFNGTTQTLGTATLTSVNGLMQATFSTSSLSVGKNTIAATYNGNTDFFSSTSGNLVETVNASATTGAALSSAPPWITVWAKGPLDMTPLDDWFRRQENW